MQLIGRVNDREIFYTNYHADPGSLNKLPGNNWLVVPIGEAKDIELYSVLAQKCIANDVLYVCTLGKCCELIHDIFDETIVAKKIDSGVCIEDFDGSPMTTWHYNFSEGFWFALTQAYDDHERIDKVVCIDFTEKRVERHLRRLTVMINQDWLPPEGETEEPTYDN